MGCSFDRSTFQSTWLIARKGVSRSYCKTHLFSCSLAYSHSPSYRVNCTFRWKLSECTTKKQFCGRVCWNSYIQNTGYHKKVSPQKGQSNAFWKECVKISKYFFASFWIVFNLIFISNCVLLNFNFQGFSFIEISKLYCQNVCSISQCLIVLSCLPLLS